jgi:pilus assembly protein CpaB
MGIHTGSGVGRARGPGWGSDRGAPSAWRRELRRALTYHRRLLAAGLAAAAVAVGLGAVSPEPEPTATVVVAATDLPGGRALTGSDVRLAAVPVAAAPDGALSSTAEVAGRRLATPARRGEVLTDVRLVGPTLLAGQGGGMVAAPLRVADAGVLAVVRPGDVVDVVAAETALDPPPTLDGSAAADLAPGVAGTQTRARTVARAVPVLAVPEVIEDPGGGLADTGFGADGALLVVATSAPVAADLAAAAVTARLSIVLRPD